MKVLVISDLHCHSVDRKSAQSFLQVGAAMTPAAHHPFSALHLLLDSGELTFDAILCPGDLADQADRPGLRHSWDLLSLLAAKAGGAPLISTIGNHDVDSHRLHGGDAFDVARRLAPDFPVPGQPAKDQYFASGFCTVEISRELEVVCINSVFNHTDEDSAKRGTFLPDRVAELRARLGAPQPGRNRIALLHHHPVLHSSPILKDSDVLETGDQLLEVLSELQCGLALHGHKHHPRLKLVTTPAGTLPVLAAGSFSADLHQLGSRTRNVFHLLDIAPTRSPLFRFSASIRTWEWRQGVGWMPSSSDTADFPARAGFGTATAVPDIADALGDWLDTNPGRWHALATELHLLFPDLGFLTPDEQKLLGQLVQASGHRLTPTPDGFELLRLVA